MAAPHEPYWHKRRLPHFEGGSIPQGVTFRLADSLPRHRLFQLNDFLANLDESRATTERVRRINALLDEGHGAAWLKNPSVAEVMRNSLMFFNGQRYVLHAWVIMPHNMCTYCSRQPKAGRWQRYSIAGNPFPHARQTRCWIEPENSGSRNISTVPSGTKGLYSRCRVYRAEPGQGWTVRNSSRLAFQQRLPGFGSVGILAMLHH